MAAELVEQVGGAAQAAAHEGGDRARALVEQGLDHAGRLVQQSDAAFEAAGAAEQAGGLAEEGLGHLHALAEERLGHLQALAEQGRGHGLGLLQHRHDALEVEGAQVQVAREGTDARESAEEVERVATPTASPAGGPPLASGSDLGAGASMPFLDRAAATASDIEPIPALLSGGFHADYVVVEFIAQSRPRRCAAPSSSAVEFGTTRTI